MAERPKWHQPPKYQLAFDYGAHAVEASSADELRFTYAVKEEVAVRSPADAGRYLLYQVYTPFAAFDQEEAWVLLLNHKYRITHQSMLYRGTINLINMRVAEIFKPAVRFNAAAIVLSHVHPSGDPTPSPEDIAVSQAIQAAGKVLQVEVVDHLVVGRNCWWSLREHQQAFAEMP